MKPAANTELSQGRTRTVSSGGSGKLMTKKRGRVLPVTRSDKDDSSEGRLENWVWRKKEDELY